MGTVSPRRHPVVAVFLLVLICATAADFRIDINYDVTDDVIPKKRNCTRDIQIIDRLLNGTGYNKFRIPKDDPVEVIVQFWMQSISAINEITSDFDLDMYINENWVDPALNFEQMNPCKENLSLSHQVLDRLWTPNSCFVNSKMAEIHDSPFKNVFLMLYPNGTVWVNYRTRIKGPCAMELSNFPLDIQTCSLIYESFNYNNHEVNMVWHKEPVTSWQDISLPDFDLLHVSTDLQKMKYPAGYWNELHIKFVFERRYIWYFMQAYLPTYLTIFISWVSFSLGPRAIPARTMLGVNALLAMIFQFGNIMRNLPRVSYIKAIDVWMLVSMTFIFLSLLELAIVGYKVKDETPNAKRKHTLCKKVERAFESNPPGLCRYDERFMLPLDRKPNGIFKVRMPKWPPAFVHWSPEKIDRVSSMLFPTAFAIFNIVYWSYYSIQKMKSRAKQLGEE